MVRGLLNVVAVLSLLLCVTAAALGVRSFYRKDKLEYVSEGGRLVMLISTRGRLDVLHNAQWGGDPGFTHVRGSPGGLGLTDYSRRVLGFGAGGRADGTKFVNIPYWVIALLFSQPSMGAYLARLRRRRRRRTRGACRACGYDLTGNVSGVCPECGAAGVAAIAQQ